MFELVGLFLIPIAVGGIAFHWSKRKGLKWSRISVRELIILEVISLALATGGFFYARDYALQSTEHWNGRITGKNHGTQGCCHCTEHCSTCTDEDGHSYECDCVEVCDHPKDYFWSVKVSTGDEVTIASCISNSANIPAAWTLAKFGDPASVQHTYRNYLKADPGSVLPHQPFSQQVLDDIPPFPSIRNHYKVNKVVRHHNIPVDPQWDNALQELNADLGASHQVDITMVFTFVADPSWADVLEEKWLFGPKNALIIVVGSPDKSTIEWVRIVSISRVPKLQVALERKLKNYTLQQPTEAVDFIRKQVKTKFVRTPMAEFEYLMDAFSMPWLLLLGLYLFSAGSTALLAWIFHEKVDW